MVDRYDRVKLTNPDKVLYPASGTTKAEVFDYYVNVAENRANHFRRNSGGQAGGREAKYAESFQSIFPRAVDEL